MCQAYEGEWNYMISQDRATRLRGYNAQKAGIPRDANPEHGHDVAGYSDKLQWWYGWDMANKGREFE